MQVKPLFSAFNAWSCIVVCVFAIVILSSIGGLFKNGHHSVVGTEEDPEDGRAVASAVFAAVFVYVIFLAFCASQAWLHMYQNRRGAITLN